MNFVSNCLAYSPLGSLKKNVIIYSTLTTLVATSILRRTGLGRIVAWGARKICPHVSQISEVVRKIKRSVPFKIEVQGKNGKFGDIIEEGLTTTFLEEFLCRELFQCQFLPGISKIFPKPIGKVINHKITRVALTSLFFASLHDRVIEDAWAVSGIFAGGIGLGMAREISGGLVDPIFLHALFNLTKYL